MLALALLPVLLFGCPGTKADNYPVCVETPTSLTADEVSPGGFSANDLLTLAAGARSDTLAWSDGTTTPLALSVTSDGEGAQWIDSVADYTGVSIDIGILCTPRLEVPATVSFVTDNGAFDEAFDTALVGTDAASAGFTIDLVDASLAGTFDPTDWPTTEYDTLDMALSGTFDASGDTGVIAGSTILDEGCDSDVCSASSESLDVATWAASPPM